MTTRHLIFVVALLGACNRGPSSDALAKADRIRAESTDPAVIDALSDPILADRGLSVQDDSLRVRATPGPVIVAYPPADGQPPIVPPVARCDGPFARGMEWAGRLPPALPVFPGARVAEAAGREAEGCRVRFVRFATDATPRALIEFYRARAGTAGFTVQEQRREGDLVLSGAGVRGAYTLVASPRPRGANVALVVNFGAPAP